jgi:hypothetical protein
MAAKKDQGKSGYLDAIRNRPKDDYEITLTDSGARVLDDSLYKIGRIMSKLYENNRKENPKMVGHAMKKSFMGVIDDISVPLLLSANKRGINEISRHHFFTSDEKKRHLDRYGESLYFPMGKQPQYGALGNEKTSRILLAAYMQYITENILEHARSNARLTRDGHLEINATNIKETLREDVELSNILKMKPSSSKSKSPPPSRTKSPSKKGKKDYDKMTVAQLYTEAQELKIPGRSNLRKEGKAALLAAVKKASSS